MASAYLFAMLAVTPSESREVALIANPEFEAARGAGHRARRLLDGGNTAFSDPFLLMAEDWVPRDAFSQHPHRGIETVTLVLDGALEHFDSAGNAGVIYTGDAQWMSDPTSWLPVQSRATLWTCFSPGTTRRRRSAFRRSSRASDCARWTPVRCSWRRRWSTSACCRWASSSTPSSTPTSQSASTFSV